MIKKAKSAAEVATVPKKQEGTEAEKKAPAKKPINPFTAEHGRKLGRGGKSGPSRTAWRT
jgi:hypothetical protein